MLRRICKTVAEWTGSVYDPVSTNYFLYTGWNLITEIDNAMEPIRTYVWGSDLSGSLQGAGGVGGLLSVADVATSRFPAFDGNGNLTALVDSANSSLDAVYEYDPYGNLLRASGPAAEDNPFRFSTKYQDEETGLVYYGHRHYSPELGRWLNRDPIGEVGSINLLTSFFNNPLRYVDKNGLENWGGGQNEFPRIEFPDQHWVPEPIIPWYDDLPGCPCSIPIDEDWCPVKGWWYGEGWSKPAPSPPTHPGATWEIRWDRAPFYPGQQCEYDVYGNLITEYPAAGTPDKGSFNPERLFGKFNPANLWHGIVDVLPLLPIIGDPGNYPNIRPPNTGAEGFPCPPNSGVEIPGWEPDCCTD